ncbi:MAG: hypothetical protein IPP69_18040, partial [Flavobacteriales bacterium]|nr:hypothetical protein [Flavobacteriales bacterium]
ALMLDSKKKHLHGSKISSNKDSFELRIKRTADLSEIETQLIKENEPKIEITEVRQVSDLLANSTANLMLTIKVLAKKPLPSISGHLYSTETDLDFIHLNHTQGICDLEHNDCKYLANEVQSNTIGKTRLIESFHRIYFPLVTGFDITKESIALLIDVSIGEFDLPVVNYNLKLRPMNMAAFKSDERIDSLINMIFYDAQYAPNEGLQGLIDLAENGDYESKCWLQMLSEIGFIYGYNSPFLSQELLSDVKNIEAIQVNAKKGNPRCMIEADYISKIQQRSCNGQIPDQSSFRQIALDAQYIPAFFIHNNDPSNELFLAKIKHIASFATAKLQSYKGLKINSAIFIEPLTFTKLENCMQYNDASAVAVLTLAYKSEKNIAGLERCLKWAKQNCTKQIIGSADVLALVALHTKAVIDFKSKTQIECDSLIQFATKQGSLVGLTIHALTELNSGRKELIEEGIITLEKCAISGNETAAKTLLNMFQDKNSTYYSSERSLFWYHFIDKYYQNLYSSHETNDSFSDFLNSIEFAYDERHIATYNNMGVLIEEHTEENFSFLGTIMESAFNYAELQMSRRQENANLLFNLHDSNGTEYICGFVTSRISQIIPIEANKNIRILQFGEIFPDRSDKSFSPGCETIRNQASLIDTLPYMSMIFEINGNWIMKLPAHTDKKMSIAKIDINENAVINNLGGYGFVLEISN